MPAVPSRRPSVRLRRQLWRLRHLLAALCVGVSVLIVVAALRPGPPATQPAVVLTHHLPAGDTLEPADLTVRAVPHGAVPDGALTRPEDAVGETLAVGLPPGSALTPGMLVGPGLGSSAPPGSVVVPITLADRGSAELARPGTRVDLLAAAGDLAATHGPAEVLATDVLVLAALPTAGTGGLLGTGPSTEATTVFVATGQSAATLLVGASAWAPLRAVQAQR